MAIAALWDSLHLAKTRCRRYGAIVKKRIVKDRRRSKIGVNRQDVTKLGIDGVEGEGIQIQRLILRPKRTVGGVSPTDLSYRKPLDLVEQYHEFAAGVSNNDWKL